MPSTLINYYIISLICCLILFLILIYSDKPKEKGAAIQFKLHIPTTFFLSFIPAVNILVIFMIGVYLYKLSEDESLTEEELEERNNEIEEFRKAKLEIDAQVNKSISKIIGAKYVGGHESHVQSETGVLCLMYNRILFTPFDSTTYFEVPLEEIKNTVYDLSEEITLGRVLLIGLSSVLFKKKTYYLIVEYTSSTGVNNQVIFDTGDKKNQEFFNKLNVQKNQYISFKTNLDTEKNSKETKENIIENKNIIIEQIRNLSKLKDDGILTEVEFEEKKKILLDKIM